MSVDDLFGNARRNPAGQSKSIEAMPPMPRLTVEDFSQDKEPFAFDVECYPNYFCVAFVGVRTRRAFVWVHGEHDESVLKDILVGRRLIGFNSSGYDLPICSIACEGKTSEELYHASVRLIGDEWTSDILDDNGARLLRVNMIDVRGPAPLSTKLKIYAARLNCEYLQDLPYHPTTELAEGQKRDVERYCLNDCVCTIELYLALRKEVGLRLELGKEYRMDLRSKSDQKVAELIIREMLDAGAHRPDERGDHDVVRYTVPDCVYFQSDDLNEMVEALPQIRFEVGKQGRVVTPPELKNRTVTINGSGYALGIGGLHSCEQSVSHYADDEYEMSHLDVSSYYPAIILANRLSPKQIDTDKFLRVYKTLVDRRLEAKRKGDKNASDALKIAINGVYGKFSEPYGKLLYSPDVGPNVSITGQLLLLMLIERLEMERIKVVSANTDGVIVRYKRGADVRAVCGQWEYDTSMSLDGTLLRSLHSRDVNNYVAITVSGGVMAKGVFAPPSLWKNPANQIVFDAVIARLRDGTEIEESVYGCGDVRRFLTVRYVKGGAVWNGRHLGEVIRWYISMDQSGHIVYAKNGNKVPLTDRVKPAMTLPKRIPADLNKDAYIRMAQDALRSVGYGTAKPVQTSLFDL